MKKIDTPLEMYEIEDFLTQSECDHLIGLILKSKTPSTVADPGSTQNSSRTLYRTSDTCMLSTNDEIVNQIDERMCSRMCIDSSFGEAIQGQYYGPGQYFKQHTDYFDPGTPSYEHHTKVTGNRTWTFMIYLNDDLEGGETEFPKLNLKFKPTTGKALIWRNTDSGRLFPDSLHTGKPVKSGKKIIITKWFREKSMFPIKIPKYKISFEKLRSNTADAIQLTSMLLYDQDEKLCSPSNVSNPYGRSPRNEKVDNLFKNNTNCKWFDFNKGCVEFELSRELLSYSFVTGNDCQGRDPVSWTISKQINNKWVPLSTIKDANVPQHRLRTFGPFYITKQPAPQVTCHIPFVSEDKIVLLHWFGRFGNRMFQYMFGCSLAKKRGVKFYYPSDWEGTLLFEPCEYAEVIPEQLQKYLNGNREHKRKEQLSAYKKDTGDTISFYDSRNEDFLSSKNVAFADLNCMYFSKLYEVMDLRYVQEIFKWSQLVKDTAMYKTIYNLTKTYDVIHVRRGDIARTTYRGAHSLIDNKCYKTTSQDFCDPIRTCWLSDDQQVRKMIPEFDSLPRSQGHRWSYPTGEKYQNNDIIFDFLPELLVMTFARRIVRANSSFSFWGVVLSGLTDDDVKSPVIQNKPKECHNRYYKQDKTEFVNGNSPHFMGSHFDVLCFFYDF